MLGALAQIVPERVPAAGEGGNSVICISGLRTNRKPFIIVDMICGAWGGRPDKDGLEAVTNASQNLSNMPVEVMEAEHPVRVEEYAFVPDTCGAGKWRGGVGLRRSYRILASEALLRAQDCVLIVTDHSAYDWQWVVDQAGLIVDTRNALRDVAHEGPLRDDVTGESSAG